MKLFFPKIAIFYTAIKSKQYVGLLDSNSFEGNEISLKFQPCHLLADVNKLLNLSKSVSRMKR